MRNNLWKLAEKSQYDTADSAGIAYSLALKDVANARGGVWAEGSSTYDCTCVFTVDITATKMTTTLEIQNTGTTSFDFQTLQHTYFLVDDHAAMDASQCYVKGLQGYMCSDKITKKEEFEWEDETVTIPGLTDRVYSPPPGKDVVEVTIGVGKSHTISMSAKGTVADKAVPVACVVWNPHEEKAAAMGDFGDDQVRAIGNFVFGRCPSRTPLLTQDLLVCFDLRFEDSTWI